MADNQQGNTQVENVEQSTPVLRVPSSTSTLKLKFGTLSGEKTFSFANANSAADEEDVKALAQAMIANGSIYKYPPLVISEAWTELKTINQYNVGS